MAKKQDPIPESKDTNYMVLTSLSREDDELIVVFCGDKAHADAEFQEAVVNGDAPIVALVKVLQTAEATYEFAEYDE